MFRSIEEMMARPKFPNTHIYILNSSGCHGHYLTYLIDRLSTNTPSITELPFNNLGNSHARLEYSGYACFLDGDQYQDKHLEESNIIKLIYPNDILYYERVSMARAGDADRDLHNLHLDISFMETYNKSFYEKIKKLYNVSSNRIPKFIVRDAYKLGFLDWANQGSVISSKEDIGWINNNLKDNNNLYLFEVNKFFSLESMRKELKIIDELFSLNLNLEELEYVHTEFIKRNKILNTQQRTEQVLNAISNNSSIKIPELDILQQAYVYAILEKNNDFITMPMTETFFTDTQEIIDYINYYPEHYKAMNPNLPIFNNIPNPFFLHGQNNK
jgi:hypothetical protein